MYRIIFFGTPEYAVPFLEGLCSAGLTPIAVVTQPDRPMGRKQEIIATPVKKRTLEYGIPILQFENVNAPESIERIQHYNPDVIVVVAFGQILAKQILELPTFGCINVHPSLLPRHRGPAPSHETILQGDEETGVTIMLMDEKMDHGPILAQQKLPVDPRETLVTLHAKTIAIGVPLLINTLKKMLERSIMPLHQDHPNATTTRLLTRDSGKLDFSQSVEKIDRQIRALNPWPGTWMTWHTMRVKILEAHPILLTNHRDHPVGELAHIDEILYLNCNNGSLRIDTIQPEGKKPMKSEEFIRGYKRLLERKPE